MALDELIAQIATSLKNSKLMLATAESCTGGGLSYVLTSFSGSSDWFERGFVTYSNEAKIEMLGVNESTIQREGAVSEFTAREMAEGALKHSHASMSIAITGIAGPNGGSPDKPVGTVWIAWAKLDAATITELFHFPGDREAIRKQSIMKALDKLLYIIG